MLIKYSVENYKSIKNKETINFMARPFANKEHLLNNNVLPVIALYGPNGGGKTAVLESIFNGANVINRAYGENTPMVYNSLKNDITKPIKWEFTFLNAKNQKLTYKIHFSDRICYEEFYMNESLNNGKKIPIFKKDLNLSSDDQYIIDDNELENIMLETLKKDNSWLIVFYNFFKNENIGSLIKEFEKFNWLNNALPINQVLYGPNSAFFGEVEIDFIKNNQDKLIKVFKDLDINIHKIEIINDPIIGSIKQILIHKKNSYDEDFVIEYFSESTGTQKLIILLTKFIMGITKNQIFFIDEFDSGIHTSILKYLIKLFTDREVNTGGAQLIFSSHDMPTLDSKVFRKDEIYFAAINESKFTSIVSLWEFGSEIREDSSYSKRYLEGKIGYDPYIDYSLKAFKKNGK